jgi:ribonuclease P protein component
MDSSTVAAEARLRFGKERRVRRRPEYLRIQNKGRKRHTPSFVVLWTKQSPPGLSRFGFSVSRKVGNAVVRNRLKRRLREFCRVNAASLSAGKDFVVIAKPGASRLTYSGVAAELHGTLGE